MRPTERAQAMEIGESIHCRTRQQWHDWLAANHQSAKEIWLVFHKKHTHTESIPYEESVQEALCFGWIDSVIKRLDDKTYTRKFTQRQKRSYWSELNLKRMESLIKQKRVTPTSLELYAFAKQNDLIVKKRQISLIPHDILQTLRQNDPAYRNFLKLPES